MDYLIQFITRILGWLLSFVVWVAEWVWQHLLGALIAVLNLIPVPGFISAAPGVLANIPPGAVYIAQVFQLSAGLGIVLGALVLRFIIRRIPLIG